MAGGLHAQARGTLEHRARAVTTAPAPDDAVAIEDRRAAPAQRFEDVGSRIREGVVPAGDAGTADRLADLSRPVDKDARTIGADLLPRESAELRALRPREEWVLGTRAPTRARALARRVPRASS